MTTISRLILTLFLIAATPVYAAEKGFGLESAVISKSFVETLYKLTSESALNSSMKSLGVDVSDGSLYTFAFNVGQANFILLRKGSDGIVIDAGIGGGNIKPEIYASKLDDVFANIKIKAVFITHPHTDHFSLLLGKLQNQLLQSKPELILGGEQSDWTNIFSEFKLNIKSTTYLNGRGVEFTKMPDVSIKVLDLNPSAKSQQKTTGKENKLSQPILVTYNKKTILFCGDAEGDAIDKVGGVAYNLTQVAEAYKLKRPSELLEAEQDWIQKYNELNTKSIYENLESLASLYNSIFENKQITIEDLTRYLFNQENRKLIFGADIVFLPHHGANTENSQRFAGTLSANKDKQRVFFISSTPIGTSKIPKKSTIDIICESPLQLSHPITYVNDTEKKHPSLVMTTKPVYLTGAAPAGVYCIKIDKDNREAYLLDLHYRNDNSLYCWVNLFDSTDRINVHIYDKIGENLLRTTYNGQRYTLLEPKTHTEYTTLKASAYKIIVYIKNQQILREKFYLTKNTYEMAYTNSSYAPFVPTDTNYVVATYDYTKNIEDNQSIAYYK